MTALQLSKDKSGDEMKPDFSNIKLLVCDFDGVMTDDSVIVDENGKESVICKRGDGLGIELIKKKGIEVIVISKEKNLVAKIRCEKLKIKILYGIDDKIELFKKEIKNRNLSFDQVCYMGNDINDLDCIKEAGIGVAVADSHKKVIEIADYITTKKGGKGAVREVCDLILG